MGAFPFAELQDAGGPHVVVGQDLFPASDEGCRIDMTTHALFAHKDTPTLVFKNSIDGSDGEP